MIENIGPVLTHAYLLLYSYVRDFLTTGYKVDARWMRHYQTCKLWIEFLRSMPGGHGLINTMPLLWHKWLTLLSDPKWMQTLSWMNHYKFIVNPTYMHVYICQWSMYPKNLIKNVIQCACWTSGLHMPTCKWIHVLHFHLSYHECATNPLFFSARCLRWQAVSRVASLECEVEKCTSVAGSRGCLSPSAISFKGQWRWKVKRVKPYHSWLYYISHV